MKRNDWILIGSILLVALICYFCYQNLAMEGSEVVITIDGNEYGSYNLNQNQTIYINDTNVLVIEDGEAYMLEANCPDGLCLHQSAIDQNHESIICLPNRVVVEVYSESASDYDVIAQ